METDKNVKRVLKYLTNPDKIVNKLMNKILIRIFHGIFNSNK